MSNKKPLLAKERASHLTNHMASVLNSVNKLIELKAIGIMGNTISIYKEIITAQPAPETYVKNLYLYMRLTHRLTENQSLYVKDIEDHTILAQYTNQKALLFL